MYKFNRNRQFSLSDFNQPIGLKMNPKNRWIKKAETIPWNEIEEQYASLFPSETGMPAKPLQTALGSLLIQKQYGYSGRELVEQIRENPYYQYFIGLPGYQDKIPFVPSLLVEFRKRLTDEILAEINEMIAEYNSPQNPPPCGGDDPDSGDSETDNRGTLILDATCVPQQISYPQDVNLLNEARENLEAILDEICYEYNYYKPRMYRQKARQDYLNLAKCKKRTGKKIRHTVKKQLQYIRRDVGYIVQFVQSGVKLTEKQKNRLNLVTTVYEQQRIMFEDRTRSVPHRIVSLAQPWVRPIVRGKPHANTEFGTKLHISLVDGYARIERLDFEAFNEAEDFWKAVYRYHDRYGRWPERILADKIYRNQQTLAFCREHGIRLSGPALGRPAKNPNLSALLRKQEYQDLCDRNVVEGLFGTGKTAYGLGRISVRLEESSCCVIGVALLLWNLTKGLRSLWRAFLRLGSYNSQYI